MIDFMAQHCFGAYCISLYGFCIFLTALGLICLAIAFITKFYGSTETPREL